MQCAAPRRAERQSNMELLRIVAMLLVVIFHAACALDVSIPEGEFSVAHFFLRLCYAAGDLGNSLFILISGHFLVRSAFSLRRVLRLWAQALFYSLLLGALALAAGRHFSAREALQVVAPVLSNSYWFITGYIAFSFFIPFLNRLFAGLERREFKRLLAAMFVVFSLLPTVAPGGFVRFTKLTMFFFLYSLAAYLRLYPDAAGAFARPWRCFAAAAALVALLLGYYALCFRFGGRFSFLRLDRFDHMSALPQVGLSLLLFLGFRGLRVPRLRPVNAVASACLGVFLIHYNYAWRDRIWEWLAAVPPLAALPLPMFLLTAAALVYAACTALDLLRQKAVEPLYMRLIDRIPPVRRELEARANAAAPRP